MADVTFCSKANELNAMTYLVGMSRKRYGDMHPDDRESLPVFHGHMKSCQTCRKGYIDMKTALSSGDGIMKGLVESFKPRNFKILRENEEYMDRTMA
jgi:hypothetical protein